VWRNQGGDKRISFFQKESEDENKLGVEKVVEEEEKEGKPLHCLVRHGPS